MLVKMEKTINYLFRQFCLRDKIMKKKAFTLVEVMVAIILMVLVLTALWSVFSSSQKNAKEILENHAINDALDRTLIRITEDVREANSVDEDMPPLYEPSDIEKIETKDEKNKLKFIKVNYDFSKDPSTLAKNEVNYTANQIEYYVEPEDPLDPACKKWALIRAMTPLDENKEVVTDKMTIHPLLKGIDECIFYRIKDPDAVRSGNIYIKIQVGRKEEDKYKNESVISVKERGAMPES